MSYGSECDSDYSGNSMGESDDDIGPSDNSSAGEEESDVDVDKGDDDDNSN